MSEVTAFPSAEESDNATSLGLLGNVRRDGVQVRQELMLFFQRQKIILAAVLTMV